VIIGAGPYGLSLAAHVNAEQREVRVFGKPMEFWQKMPEDFILNLSGALRLFLTLQANIA